MVPFAKNAKLHGCGRWCCLDQTFYFSPTVIMANHPSAFLLPYFWMGWMVYGRACFFKKCKYSVTLLNNWTKCKYSSPYLDTYIPSCQCGQGDIIHSIGNECTTWTVVWLSYVNTVRTMYYAALRWMRELQKYIKEGKSYLRGHKSWNTDFFKQVF